MIRASTSPTVEFQDKMQYVNREIDRTMKYFSWSGKSRYLTEVLTNLYQMQQNREIDIEELIQEEEKLNQQKGLE